MERLDFLTVVDTAEVDSLKAGHLPGRALPTGGFDLEIYPQVVDHKDAERKTFGLQNQKRAE